MLNFLLLLWVPATLAVQPGRQYVLSPASRAVRPLKVVQTTGSVKALGGNSSSAVSVFTLTGPNATVTYDFGLQVAGIPNFIFTNPRCTGGTCSTQGLPSQNCTLLCQALGLAYTESKDFIGQVSDKSTIYSLQDGTIFLPLTAGKYAVPSKWGRGSFRYLTISFGSNISPTTSVAVQFDSLQFTAAPNIQDDSALGAYTGYFESSDDLLNRIFYAGVYTLQLCQVSGNSSVNHAHVLGGGGWSADATAATLNGTDMMFVDGAKRDRNPWSGDMAVALRSALVSQNFQNLAGVRNLLDQYFTIQQNNKLSSFYGYLPYAGSPLGNIFIEYGAAINTPPYGSDTYNLWALLNAAEYIIVTNDTAWGASRWGNIIEAIAATYPFVDSSTGLFNGTRTLDWGRIGQGGQNTALNALYYQTLTLLADIAPWMPKQAGVTPTKWKRMASQIKRSVNSLLYDNSAGLFYDNTTTAGHKIHPQDGNSLAVLFNLTATQAQAAVIANNLVKRLTPQGLPPPELPGAISPFISSMTLRALFIAQPSDVQGAMQVLRTQWGFMLNQFSNSTMIEGYASNGTLAYPFYPNGQSFVSHTHAWSTGPVYSLLANLVGLRATLIDEGPKRGRWTFQPLVMGSGVTSVKGGYTTRAGSFSASWNSTKGLFSANLSTPASVSGSVYIPAFGKSKKALDLVLDGVRVSNLKLVNGFIEVDAVHGGTHVIRLTY